MKKTFILSYLLFCLLQAGSAQVPSTLIGEWSVFEIKTDRFYKNFETDSIHYYSQDDHENYQIGKTQIDAFLKEIQSISIWIKSDSILSIHLPSAPMSEFKYTYSPNPGLIIFGSTANQDTIKINPNNNLEMGSPDRLMTFKPSSKPKSSTTNPALKPSQDN